MMLRQRAGDESGQGSSEYALLVGGIVVMVIVATTLFSGSVQSLFLSIGTFMNGVFT
jgi:Flp pilus assembly pilin Flp